MEDNKYELIGEYSDLIHNIQQNIEWLETTEGDEIECIGIENLEGILSRFFNKTIKLSING
jgi:hypothetical protein